MAGRGPIPLPHEALHSWRRNERAATQVRPDCVQPEPPNWLTQDEKSHFRLMAEEMAELGIAASIDAGILARYCRSFFLWLECQQFISENGATFESENGPKLHPQARLATVLATDLARMEAALGFTPAARARLVVTKPAKKDNPKDRFFQKPNPFQPRKEA